jgi:hypothetical protein
MRPLCAHGLSNSLSLRAWVFVALISHHTLLFIFFLRLPRSARELFMTKQVPKCYSSLLFAREDLSEEGGDTLGHGRKYYSQSGVSGGDAARLYTYLLSLF